jgi:hypothetical protein
LVTEGLNFELSLFLDVCAEVVAVIARENRLIFSCVCMRTK